MFCRAVWLLNSVLPIVRLSKGSKVHEQQSIVRRMYVQLFNGWTVYVQLSDGWTMYYTCIIPKRNKTIIYKNVAKQYALSKKKNFNLVKLSPCNYNSLWPKVCTK